MPWSPAVTTTDEEGSHVVGVESVVAFPVSGPRSYRRHTQSVETSTLQVLAPSSSRPGRTPETGTVPLP